MEVLAYRADGAVAVEIPGVIDFHQRRDVLETLLGHLRACEEPELVVHLHDCLVTSTALDILCELHSAATEHAVAVRVMVPPLAVKVFTVTGLEHLLNVRPTEQAGRV
ncbi:hypothetical protein GA0115240_16195 [Streptomyces sp. DvalAA-14]|uniref:hypothetical protein n=1 Tax=unclassified Streptomyces TaxID=2593676 RepID=UPI00081AFECF|nr:MULTISPECIES: hypothetical protein [unclassified Streptomyces]MYS24247.1 hypothetical protein [Streptomyces sp. SID4948]SCE44205.1 hypothetical protein GA0115240_16195 [Streptomyces sp. DvalAA-14]